MKTKKKISLQDLKLDSFVTSFKDDVSKETIKGGSGFCYPSGTDDQRLADYIFQ